MARWIFVSFLVVCLLCIVQAFPQSVSDPQPTTAATMESALNGVIDSLKKGLQGIVDDPSLNQVYKDGRKALADAANVIREEAAKIVPKTDN